MTADKAIYKFFDDFMQAYPDTSVPDEVKLPYLTYTFTFSAFGDGEQNMTVRMWFRSESEAMPNEVVRQFKKYVEEKGMIKVDSGYVWLKLGSPFCINLSHENDTAFKLRQINLLIEMLNNE